MPATLVAGCADMKTTLRQITDLAVTIFLVDQGVSPAAKDFDEVDVWLAVVDHFVRSSKLSKSLARCAVQDCDGLKEGKRPGGLVG